MKNGLHSGHSNPRPLEHESPTLTSRSWHYYATCFLDFVMNDFLRTQIETIKYLINENKTLISF